MTHDECSQENLEAFTEWVEGKGFTPEQIEFMALAKKFIEENHELLIRLRDYGKKEEE